MQFYAGIGARATPQKTLVLMTKIARRLQDRGYCLRSGGAKGADTAFASGAWRCRRVYRPNDATRLAGTIASRHHPNWQACTPYVRDLHARNAMIVLGDDCDDPVDFVVCWTPDGEITGGTGLGIRIAKFNGIPVFNLFDEAAALEGIRELLNKS